MPRSTASRSVSAPALWLSVGTRETFEKEGTVAYRIASASDGWVERLGDDVLISHKNEAILAELCKGLEAWCAQESWNPARIFRRYMPLKNADRVAPVLHSGDAESPLTTVVKEAGLSYGLDFAAGYSHGLFLDQRANRAKLAVLSPKKLLNTFAYTCSFTVVAAKAGAETLSVDLSRKSLDRGRQNLALNGLPDTKHRFVADDALELLPRLAHQGEKFDAIILDPPTFSRGNNGRLWQVEQHFEDLLMAALEVAAPKCAILLSTNCTKVDEAGLERQARACARIKRRTADYSRTHTPVDFPNGHGAKTLWMMAR